MDKYEANKILQEIESGYNLMADKFSETRKYFWRGLEFIGDCVKGGDKVLDYGCGNGRLLDLLYEKNISYTGIDISQKLINIARNKYKSENINFYKIDASQSSLPFESNYFNTIYSVAVLHHMPSEELRREITKELHRVLKPGGQIIITVWNLWQRKYLKNIFGNWLNKVVGKNNLDWNDCYIAFKNNKGEVFNRYHHAFTGDELINLFFKTGFFIERCEVIDKRNIILVGKK